MTSSAPSYFHVLAKPTGAICNLDCKYCFFLSKEMLYPGSRFHMADELLEIYIKQLLDAHGTPEVIIAWQGGEKRSEQEQTESGRSEEWTNHT
jgi:uncharacterized protein